MIEPGRRFAPFFTAVCIYMRQRTGKSAERIADLIGVQGISVKRFEEGKTFPDKNIEPYAAAYAYDAKIDPRDIFQLAVEWWRQHGARPLTTEETQDGQVEARVVPADIVLAIRRAERERDAAASRPTSTRRKKAAGE